MGLALEILGGSDPSKMYDKRSSPSPFTASLRMENRDSGVYRIVGVFATANSSRTYIYVIGKRDYLLRQFTAIEQSKFTKYTYEQKYINVRANPNLPASTILFVPPKGTKAITLPEIERVR